MHASTMAETALLSVASHWWDMISPPASSALSTVSRIESASRSTAKILAPSRAKIAAMARPLPQPGPTQPAPTTIATLPSSLPAIGSISDEVAGHRADGDPELLVRAGTLRFAHPTKRKVQLNMLQLTLMPAACTTFAHF